MRSDMEYGIWSRDGMPWRDNGPNACERRLLYLLCFEHVDNLGAYSIPSETGLLIPSVYKLHLPPYRLLLMAARC